MALLKRQTFTAIIFDDQSPTLYNNFVGNWTRGTFGKNVFYNNTVTETSTPGSTFSVAFKGMCIVSLWLCSMDADTNTESGSQAVVYGGVVNNTNTDGTTFLGFPTASYVVDGISCELLGQIPPSVAYRGSC